MTLHRIAWSGLVAIMLASSGEAMAQVFVAPAPVAFYVAPAPVVSFPVPVVTAAPTVSFYTAAAAAPVVAAPVVPVSPVAAVPAAVGMPVVPTVPSTVSFYTPVPVGFPARVSRGLFGRTIIRTPFSVTRTRF